MQPTELFFNIIFTLILLAIGYYLGVKIQRWRSRVEFEKILPDIRKDAISKSRAVLSGQFSEQLAPYLPDFPYKPTEVRFIGKPIDFLVFNGMDEKQINEVVFVEVKTSTSKLTPVEKSLRDTIESKRISWREYRLL